MIRRFVLLMALWLAAHPAVADRRADSLLVTGARAKQMRLVEQALRNGANVESIDEIGRTPLIWAAFQGSAPILAVLLAHGAKVDARDRRGRTALIWAAITGRDQVVGTLLAHGADATLADEAGATAADWAAREGHGALSARLRAAEPE